MVLSPEDRQAFLAEAHVAAIAVAETVDRGPLTVPIWYLYEPGGDLRIRTRPDSRKARAIAERGRVSLMVQTVTPTVRYVSVEGPVVSTELDSPELARTMASATCRLTVSRSSLPSNATYSASTWSSPSGRSAGCRPRWARTAGPPTPVGGRC